MQKGLIIPNDEKFPRLKFPVDILVSSFNAGSCEIADEIATMPSKSNVNVFDMTEKRISSDEESSKVSDAVSTENYCPNPIPDLEPFAIKSSNSSENVETWLGIVSRLFYA